VVTGASTGFGAAIARHLAERGFRVFGTVRRAEDEVALARDGVTPVRMDVTDTASIMRARGEVERALGTAPLMALVNNAGIPAAGPLELFPLDELRQILEVNLIGAVAVTQAFLALLKASRGRIVNISSVAGRGALPFLGPYAASKFGLEAISDSLRRELLPFGVRVIVIEPGSFKTAIWSKVEAMDRRRYAGTPYEGARAIPAGVAARGGASAAARQGGPGGVASAQRAATAAARDRHPARVARSDSLVDPRPLARLVDLPLSVAGGAPPAVLTIL